MRDPAITSRNIYLSATREGFDSLAALLKAGKRIDRIVTVPARDAARISDYADFSPLAARYGIPVSRTVDGNAFLRRRFKQANLLVANGWSRLIRPDVLSQFTAGGVGIHPSLLPRNRGRAPIPWHFINRERFGGVTLFYLDEGCDSGPIIAQSKFRITPSDNASTYYRKMTRLSARMLVDHFDAIASGNARRFAKPQDGRRANYLSKRTPADSAIRFTRSAAEVVALVRAVTDIYPLAYFTVQGRRYRVRFAGVAKSQRRLPGKAGQIVAISRRGIRVRCASGIVDIGSIIDSHGKYVDPQSRFKVRERLDA